MTQKNKKKGFQVGTLGASLVGNLLVGKGAITVRQRRGTIRAGEGTIRASQGF